MVAQFFAREFHQELFLELANQIRKTPRRPSLRIQMNCQENRPIAAPVGTEARLDIKYVAEEEILQMGDSPADFFFQVNGGVVDNRSSPLFFRFPSYRRIQPNPGEGR
jgi:hypothetical protein